jgi:hypothetical protein
VSLRKKEDVIYQYTKNFPMYFDKERYDFIKKNGISLEDSFPVVEGEHKLIILIQNSVGKEFSVYEQEMAIPVRTAQARIEGPILGYKFESYQSGVLIPFKMIDKKLVVDPKNTFSVSDDIIFTFNILNVSDSIWDKGRVEVHINSVDERKTSQKSRAMDLKNFSHQKIINVNQTIKAGELLPNYYEMKLTLIGDGDEILDERIENFIISPAQSIAHPVAHAKGFSLDDSYLYYYVLANQYEKLGNYARAEENFERAFSLNPEYKKGLIEYANFLFNIICSKVRH